MVSLNNWNSGDLKIVRVLTLVVVAWLSIWTLAAFTGPGVEKDIVLMFVAQVGLGLWTGYFAWTFPRGHLALRMLLFTAFVQIPQMIAVTLVGSYKTGLSPHDFMISYWYIMALVVAIFTFILVVTNLYGVIVNHQEVDKANN